jgi:SAM-dependent methyltransferase
VEIKGEAKLSLTLHQRERDTTKNLLLSDCAKWLGNQIQGHYRSALLNTIHRDWQLFIEENGQPRLVSHKPAFTVAPGRGHDRAKHTFLDPGAQDWLHGLEITDASGKVRPSMSDKHRQIDHYLEILSHLAKQCRWTEGSADQELLLADMGCGKAYLTFGAWHLFNRVWKRPARIIGVEARADLVAATEKLASRIGAKNLQFIQGTIESAPLPRLDALIALHACNTATDDALRRGIELNAKLIIVAPCCHKELRPQLGKPEPLAAVLKHGLMEERMAEWVTDGLRALYLEWAGYETKIFEFVATEHTPKNLMISAIRANPAFKDESIREKISALKKYFDIERHALDPLLPP